MRFEQKTVFVAGGAGNMGRQTALYLAGCGHNVIVGDPRPEAIEAAGRFFETMTPRFPIVENQGQIESRIRTICGTLDDPVIGEAIRHCDIIWEFVPEQLDVKRSAFHKIARYTDPTAIIASGSSAIRAAELFAEAPNAARCLKLHPFAFFPFHIPMVEMVRGPQTLDEVLESAFDFVVSLRCAPFEILHDPIGQGMNAVWEGIKELMLLAISTGRYDPSAADAMFQFFTGMFAGPVRLMDHVGLSTVVPIAKYYFENGAGIGVPDEIAQMAARGETLTTGPDGWRRGPLQVTCAGKRRTLPFITANQLAGEWRLVSMETLDREGKRVFYPLGEGATGRLVYNRFGRVTVHLRKGNDNFLEQVPAQLRPLVKDGFIFYNGRFWTELGNQIVHLTEDAYPSEMGGQRLVRNYSFDDSGRLVLDTPRGQYGEEGHVVRLVWEFATPC
ncbi:MAG: 3-hydroxyacyl-CoA dehydrogenase NAD-binding domain-containing protein [Bdellovibrionota bacterium]